MEIKDRASRKPLRLWAILFWLALWQIASMWMHNRILLVSPVAVFFRLAQLACGRAFWLSIAVSFRRIAGGFLLGTVAGTLIAGWMSVSRRAEELWTPILLVIRSVPVASFIILALVWLSSRYLAIFITFLMVFPIICTNTLEGIRACDPKLMEMAQVFRLPAVRRWRYLAIPQVFPYFYSGCKIALGLSWKAGISAEVIGMPTGTIGERLQQAKIYLDTPDLFAWTLVIILVSFLMEKGFLKLLLLFQKQMRKMPDTVVGARTKTGSRKEPEAAIQPKQKTNDKPGPEMHTNTISDIDAQRPLDKNMSVTDSCLTDIKLMDISKQFDGESVLEHFSAVFPAGEVTAVMAPSGAGKTTLLRILAGLEKADSGQLQMPYKKIGMMFQEDRLLEALCGESNIRLTAPWYSRKEVSEVMLELCLPGGSDQPVREYSGGMKRRVALLRTILSDSELLLLDEPFQGLDEESKKVAAAWILKHRQGRTLLLVTHDCSDAELLGAKKIIKINRMV